MALPLTLTRSVITPPAAYLVTVCHHAPCGLSGHGLSSRPPRTAGDAHARREGGARGGGGDDTACFLPKGAGRRGVRSEPFAGPGLRRAARDRQPGGYPSRGHPESESFTTDPSARPIMLRPRAGRVAPSRSESLRVAPSRGAATRDPRLGALGPRPTPGLASDPSGSHWQSPSPSLSLSLSLPPPLSHAGPH